MARYNLIKKAGNDIAEMYSYTVTAFGETQADKYYNGLISQIEFIASSPETYRKLERFSPAVRSLHLPISHHHLQGARQ